MSTDFSINTFDAIVDGIKTEKNSHFHDESSNLKDSASIGQSIDNKNKNQQQQEMCELASTYYEKDVNVSDSNSQELTDTKLVDGKIVSMCTSSQSTALPIMKILSPKSGLHTCLECCFKCKNVFRVLDSPLHICRIRSTDKQIEFLKIEPSLCVDSCLCNICWTYLEKTYKSNKSKIIKVESYSEKKSRLLERYVKKNVSKKQNQARKCSLHLCSQPYLHKMSVNECEKIKKLYLTFESCRLVFVQSTKQTKDYLKFPFCLCKIHNAIILVMSTCQICSDKLNAPFNTDDWSMYEMWNFVLIENNLPLILKPGMFICVTCKGNISKTNPGFPTIDLPRLRGYILISNAIRLKLYGESQYNSFNMCQGSTYEASPIVIPKIKEEKECVRSTKVKFSDPLITRTYNFDIGNYKNDNESITSTELLNVSEQNLCTRKSELKGERLDFVKHKDQITEGINQYLEIPNDNSLQNSCEVDNVEIYEIESEVIGSHQVVNGPNEIENNQSKLKTLAIYSVAKNISSLNLKKAVEQPYVTVNPVTIKRKPSNVICNTMSNKDVKKQRLNEKSYENNFIDDITTKSYSYKNIVHPSINSSSILNLSIGVDEDID